MKTLQPTLFNRSRSLKHQQGVTLIISLIMLIAMTLAGLALFRQVGGGIIVARNLTFREATIAAADRGIEAARNWIATSGWDLDKANGNNGYYAAWCNVSVNAQGIPDADGNSYPDDCAPPPPNPGDPPPGPPSDFNPYTYNWLNSQRVSTPDGTTVDFVIHRMCSTPGGVSSQNCVTYNKDDTPDAKIVIEDVSPPPTVTRQPYYRITTRAVGPMNTVAYTQAIIY